MGVSSLQRCPHYRGVLTVEVSSIQRCPHYRGVLTTDVSLLQGCPHYRLFSLQCGLSNVELFTFYVNITQ